METLMLLEAFGMVLALFASAVGVLVWILRELAGLVRTLLKSAGNSNRRRAPRAVNQWDPNHPLFSKRAGQ